MTGAFTTDFFSNLLAHPEIGADFSDATWESTVHIMGEARLLGALEARASRTGVITEYSEFARKHLESTGTFAKRQAAQVRYEAIELNSLLQAADVSPVFLKGAAYTLRGTANSLGRICTDIDVLVRHEEIEVAQQAMLDTQWRSRSLSSYDDRYYREWAHEVPPLRHRRRGTIVDLHHNIVPPVSGRAPKASVLFKHVETLADGLLVLSPQATVLHSLIHLFVNDDLTFAFRDVVDLWLLTAEYDSPEFWLALSDLAEQTGFERELWYGVRCIQAYFPSSSAGTSSVLEKLRARIDGPRSRWVADQILIPAIQPRHPEVGTTRNKLASAAAYARGHWLKMPLPILTRHVATKSWLAARDAIFGKYQFEKA